MRHAVILMTVLAGACASQLSGTKLQQKYTEISGQPINRKGSREEKFCAILNATFQSTITQKSINTENLKLLSSFFHGGVNSTDTAWEGRQGGYAISRPISLESGQIWVAVSWADIDQGRPISPDLKPCHLNSGAFPKNIAKEWSVFKGITRWHTGATTRDYAFKLDNQKYVLVVLSVTNSREIYKFSTSNFMPNPF